MLINKSSSKKRYIISAAIVGLVMIGAASYSFIQNQSDDVRRDKNGTSLERSSTEKAETAKIQKNPEDTKQSVGSDIPQPASNNPDTGLLAANVILTSTGVDNNGKVDASGFVSNITEEGGTCTFTFQKYGDIIQKTTETAVNPTSTTCLTASFDEKELGSGEWEVFLRYQSPRASGTSNNMTLVIR